MKIFNLYNLIARIFPAVIVSVPFLIFSYFYLNQADYFFLVGIIKIRWIDDITLLVILVFLFSQINRLLSKEIFEKRIFKNEALMPTTLNLMLSAGLYSDDFRSKIFDKINKDFNIDLKNGTRRSDYHKKIIEAISLVRVRVGNGRLLLQHNIEYGFFRNLIGGSFVAVFMSVFNVFFFSNIFFQYIAVKISVVLFIAFLIPILLSKIILKKIGNSYAKILIQEYMAGN